MVFFVNCPACGHELEGDEWGDNIEHCECGNTIKICSNGTVKIQHQCSGRQGEKTKEVQYGGKRV